MLSTVSVARGLLSQKLPGVIC